MNTIRKLMNRVGTGERGFTLIELLVVIAILGIIAAVVVLNIGSFLGTGAAQAANTEAHQVQTSVIAYMSYHSVSSYGAGNVGPTTSNGPEAYLLNKATLQAEYSVNSDGSLSTASKITGSKWGDLEFTNGVWQ